MLLTHPIIRSMPMSRGASLCALAHRALLHWTLLHRALSVICCADVLSRGLLRRSGRGAWFVPGAHSTGDSIGILSPRDIVVRFLCGRAGTVWNTGQASLRLLH